MGKDTHKPTALAKFGALLCLAPVASISFTTWALMRSIISLKTSDAGDLSHTIGSILIATAVGSVLALIGFPLSLWCIFVKRQRSWWLQTASVLAGLFFFFVLVHSIWNYIHPTLSGAGS